MAGCGFGNLLLYLYKEVLSLHNLPQVIYLQTLDDYDYGATEYYVKIGFKRVREDTEGARIDLPPSMQEALSSETIHFCDESLTLLSLDLSSIKDGWKFWFEDGTRNPTNNELVDINRPARQQGSNLAHAIDLMEDSDDLKDGGSKSDHDVRCKIDYIPVSAKRMYDLDKSLYQDMVECTTGSSIPFFNMTCFTLFKNVNTS